jgi:hypothetical protein
LRQRLEDAKYTVLGPDELWAFYAGAPGIYRGGGNSSTAKLVRPDSPRSRDITVIFDPEHEIQMVIPDRTKGLSFSDSIAKLARPPIISGHVWMLPRSVALPEGLVFNVKDRDHPLLNVAHPMALVELTEKLKVLSTRMKYTHVQIEKATGRILEDHPGALAALGGR